MQGQNVCQNMEDKMPQSNQDYAADVHIYAAHAHTAAAAAHHRGDHDAAGELSARAQECSRRHSPARQGTRRGSIPGTVAGPGQGTWSGARGDLPQPVLQSQGDGCSGGFGRHLHHALLSRGTGCIWDAGVCHGRRQGDHLDSILARRRTSR
jgi:hypothetical protein